MLAQLFNSKFHILFTVKIFVQNRFLPESWSPAATEFPFPLGPLPGPFWPPPRCCTWDCGIADRVTARLIIDGRVGGVPVFFSPSLSCGPLPSPPHSCPLPLPPFPEWFAVRLCHPFQSQSPERDEFLVELWWRVSLLLPPSWGRLSSTPHWSSWRPGPCCNSCWPYGFVLANGMSERTMSMEVSMWSADG